MTTTWYQKEFSIASRGYGCHLVTEDIVEQLPEIGKYQVGLLNIFIKHSSAGLTLNENFDSDVRRDMTNSLEKMAPEGNYYRHNDEGADDMPAHVKSTLVGASIDIPIRNGKLATGTWQGIWLCEFRRLRSQRKLVATIHGLER